MQITQADIYNIGNKFLNFFQDIGYEVIKSESLIQEIDKTLTYTNSTIVPLKTKLIGGIKGKGFVLLQPCLRLKNLKRDNYESPFTSFFRMVGILSSPKLSISEQAGYIKDYFTRTLKINANEITIHYNDETTELAKHFSPDFKFISNFFSAKFYNWKYGIQDIKGLGITFYINKYQSSRELGNFIEIKKGLKTVGYEFGFGIETCFGILNGISDNFQVLFNSNENKKVNDLFITLCVIKEAIGGKDKIGVFVEASIRKLKVELSYEFFRTKLSVKKLKEIDMRLFDVSEATRNNTLQEIESSIANLTNKERRLLEYINYLTKQSEINQSKIWAFKKLSEYIRKNNLGRIILYSSNEIIKKINTQFENDK